MNGGEIIATILSQHTIDCIFTLCGGHISPILVECKKKKMKIVDVRHEANAAFAADAYARITGKVGVVAVTAGPGVSNTITAVKNAQLAQVPMLILGGATATLLRGRGSLQDIDQLSLITPHVKWASRPNTVGELIPAIAKGLEIAQSDVPGPVFVEVAVDLLYPEEIVREWYSKKTDKPNPSFVEKVEGWYIRNHLRKVFAGSNHPISPPKQAEQRGLLPSTSNIKAIRAKIQQAQKPVLLIGSQSMLDPKRARELVQAVEALQIPVYLSGMARGLLGRNHPLQLRHKRTQALKEADLVILAGVPCDFRLDYGSPLRKSFVISINRSATDLYKNRNPNLPVLADAQKTLEAVAKEGGFSDRGEWLQILKQRDAQRDTEIQTMASEPLEGINPLEFFVEMQKHIEANDILVGDGGDFVASASYIVQPPAPYSWLDPGVFGTLGVGAGFALASQLCNPDGTTWLLYGDGACGFSVMEFDTCVRHNIPIIAIVGNDGGWTQIARDQVVILQDPVGTELRQMDYHKIAEGCGGHGIVLRTPEEIPQALIEAKTKAKEGIPVLINVLIATTKFREGSISM